MVVLFGMFIDYAVDADFIKDARWYFKHDKKFRVIFLKLRNALMLKKITIGQFVDYTRQSLHRAKKIEKIKHTVKRVAKEMHEQERVADKAKKIKKPKKKSKKSK